MHKLVILLAACLALAAVVGVDSSRVSEARAQETTPLPTARAARLAPAPIPPAISTPLPLPSRGVVPPRQTPGSTETPAPAYIPAGEVSVPNLETILSFQGSELPEGLNPAEVRVLVFTGDVIPARRTNYRLSQLGDYRYPFYPTEEVLRDGDLRVVNLESPLLDGCPLRTDGFPFCGDPRFIQGLQHAGIEVANLANNHSGDYGPQGKEETIVRLAEAGIEVTGVGEILYREIRGILVALVSYNGVGPAFDRRQIADQVAEAREHAGIVVALFHWGAEYVAVPTIAPGIAGDDPRQIARLAIDAGADLVIGNHPHWVQGIEYYEDRLIVYAHGNFIFDQSWSRATQEGVIGRYVFYGNRLVAARFYPVVIVDEVQPCLVEGEEAEAILGRMRWATAVMGTGGD